MKTLLQPSGDHSNRLFQLVHIVSYCLEYNQDLQVLCFDDMAPLYNDGFYCIPKHHKFITKIKTFLMKVQNRTKIPFLREVNYVNEDYMKIIPMEKLPKNCIINGWGFRCNELTTKYRKLLREKYSLKQEYYQNNELYNEIKSLDSSKFVKVGVHIRRGDYKDYEGGKYYYANETFADKMTQIENEIKKTGKQVKFYLFSNEPIDPMFIESYDAKVSKNKWYIDQFLMTQMDYLIGPPSTFTGWASFINEVPLFYISDKDCKATLSEFTVIDG